MKQRFAVFIGTVLNTSLPHSLLTIFTPPNRVGMYPFFLCSFPVVGPSSDLLIRYTRQGKAWASGDPWGVLVITRAHRLVPQ